MTSQTGKQIIAIYVLPNISRSKSNQTMKFCQLIGHNIGNSFPQIRQGGYFKISVFLPYMRQKQVVSTLVLIKSLTWTYNKNKLYKYSYC